MARTYILTEKEKATMKEFLESGKKLEDFRTIVHIARNLDQKAIGDDLELINKFLAKVGEKRQ